MDDFFDDYDYDETSNIETTPEMKDLMNIDYTYPSTDDEEFQKKIYKKREYYYNKFPERKNLDNYQDIKEYRDKICGKGTGLLAQQSFLSNYINPDTPYRGCLVFHGTGTGKCLTGEHLINIDGGLLKIEDIWNLYHVRDSIVQDCEDPNGEWAQPIREYHVLSLNEDTMKLQQQPIKRLYRQKIKEPINVLRLENGKILKITKRHKLRTEHRGWSNIYTEGTKIMVPKKCIEGSEFKFCQIIGCTEELFEGYVYDLEIEGHHNFIAEDTLVSNTCAGIAVAEKFKPLVEKYMTRIHVLVSGPLIKETWRDELLKCTGETYIKQQDVNVYLNEQDKQKAKKNALNVAQKYYRFMSYRSFYKKVLGEKIVEKVRTSDNKVKLVARKTDKGEYERDISRDRLYHLNNTLIIVDEAHHLTGNAYGEALTKIIKNSTNLKVLLLSATPMKNLADDIVELVNFLRPIDDPMSRDKVFTSQKNHLMDFKSGGIQYLKRMTKGYVSYLRGVDPLTFAERNEKGVIPEEFDMTKVTQCKMEPFQQRVYDETKAQMTEDTLDRKSSAVANFAFPCLSEDKKSIIGVSGREGINLLKNQLKSHQELLNKKIAQEILKDENIENVDDLVYISESGKTITGKILKQEHLKNFSIKFYKALKKLNRLVHQKRGSRTAFVYSNLVKVGIELFREILIHNGYLEYDENPDNYRIEPTTRCYFCGYGYGEHIDGKLQIRKGNSNISESSTEYKKKDEIPEHEYFPATFISVTGKSSEEAADIIPEEKQAVIKNVFSNINNYNGKYIKFILGSKVMNEGISLQNVAEVHILDVYFNLGMIDQVIGRAIRHCSHYRIMSEENPYPKVDIYKYAVTLERGLSSEEELYKKAEQKYRLIKKVERVLKEIAIDCPLNRNANMFPEELVKYKDCIPPDQAKPGEQACPLLCDYMSCNYKCDDQSLNREYFDPNKGKYRQIKKNDLDRSTFTNNLAEAEIDYVKGKIKELYRKTFIYKLKDIVNYVRNSFEGEKKDLFEEFFVYMALDELTPITENDFNNFRDTIFDKFNRMGYIIHVDQYYIFQPFTQNEDVPMYYRSTFDQHMRSRLTLYNYIKNTMKYSSKTEKKKIITDEVIKREYDFESVMDYYDNRDEFKYVGIIDKESSRRKVKDDLDDVFKIRDKRSKILDKKRGTGIPSLMGAVCKTSKSREQLESICHDLNIKFDNFKTRDSICSAVQKRLLFLEKYSTAKKKNKVTYIMIPKNHPVYPFPYNLEDRKDHIINDIKSKIKFDIDLKIIEKNVVVDGTNVINYQLEITNSSKLADFKDVFVNNGAELVKNKWIIKIE